MKNILLFFSFALLFTGLRAQYPLVTIQDIQTVSGPNLAACLDTSPYFGDTVRVRGIVMMDGGLAQSAGGRNIWMQGSNGGAFGGIDLFGSSTNTTSPDDVLDLVAGDSIEVLGYVDEFQGESEIRPLGLGSTVTILGSGIPLPAPTIVNISDLNDNANNNQLVTGEQYEGLFIEVQNVIVQSVTYFSGNTRVSFIVQDASGNKMNVSDRFLVQRLPAGGGTFVPPSVGDQYCFLRGVLLHSKNNCSGFNGRGYELHPFDASNYNICSAAPSIFNVTRNYVNPMSSQATTVTASITDADGIASASLKYAVGVGTMVYTSVAMTPSGGNTWQGVIPAQVNGAFVKYYVCATDSATNTSCNTNVPAPSNADPYFFTVRDNGTTIYDVQFVPSTFVSGNSGYVDYEVTVTGVVTASAQPNNLGYVFIQEEGRLDWGGIMVLGSASLASVHVGDKITVTGTVKESFGYTRIENVSSVLTAGSGTINPVKLNPSLFSTYGFATNEAYEGMLVKIASGTGSLYVVDDNADGPPSNFGEYRVGGDQFDPASGTRVLAGRQTSSTYSSLSVSYVNDSMWATTDGIMTVPPCVVNTGTMFDSITGIIYYAFSNMKLLPRNNDDFAGDLTWCLTGTEKGEMNAGKFNVYPNPSNGRFSLAYALPEYENSAVVKIHDITGREALSANLHSSAGVVSFESSSLVSGTYIVTVQGADHTLFRSRIVINR